MSSKQRRKIRENLDQIVEMNENGHNLPDICSLLGIPYSGARTIIEKEFGSQIKRHPYNKGKRTSEEPIKPYWVEIRSYLEDGYSAMELADTFGLSYMNLYHFIKRREPGLISLKPSDRRKQKYSEIRQSFNISKEDLYRMYQVDNRSMREIAEETGYCTTTIFNWINRYGIPIRDREQVTESLWTDDRRQYYRQLCYDGITGIHREFDRHGTYYTSIERQFADWCNSLDIEYEFQHQIVEGGHRYDFRIKGTKLLVELDGLYWHSTEKQLKRDEMHDRLALESGYDIIRISDKEIESTKCGCFNKVLEWTK